MPKRKPFRLLVVGVKCPPETFIRAKLEGLAREGVEVVVASVAPYWAKKIWNLQGVRFYRLPHWEDNPIALLFRFLADFVLLCVTAPWAIVTILLAAQSNSEKSWKAFFSKARVYTSLARLKADIVHFEWISAAIDYLPLFQVWKVPVTISCRGSQINIRPLVEGNDEFRLRLATVFAKSTAIHCVSEAILREAMKYGLDPNKAWVIHPAVDPDFFHPKKQSPNKHEFKVATVGSVRWVKGHEYALSAIRQLMDQGVPVRFDIIGDGPERQRVLYTIHDLELQNHVRLLGRLNPEQVRDRLQQSDVFLLSSLSEGISNAVLEAMSCGLPVVTTDCGGMREAVTDGVEGFIVPVRDPEAMAQALLRLWKEPDLRKKMGEAARERVLREFRLDQQISAFLALFESVVGSSANR